MTMILQQWLILSVEFIFICFSSQTSPQKRYCAYQVTPKNNIYAHAGNVSQSVQLCKNTQCCVGYYVVINGETVVDTLACNTVEKHCTDATCKAQRRLNGRTIKCVCNTDLCNSNITWTSESHQESQVYNSQHHYAGDTVKTALVLVGILLALCFMIITVQWKNLFKMKNKNPLTDEDYGVSQMCFRQTTKSSDINVANIELQQIVNHGNFATVWLGKYQESRVAVKVFPAGWKLRFAAEKEVYELPLIGHSGIVHFLGTAREPHRDSWLIVLQFAENVCHITLKDEDGFSVVCRSCMQGSLCTFLHENTTNWMSSLKLCLSLSQGLSYLHSNICKHDAHKPPVAHGDLSSSNVLVRADGNCVLCDFECATILYSFSRQSHTTSVLGRAQCGTLRYMAPEILEGSVNLQNTRYLLQADIYSLALLLWEIWLRCSDLYEGSTVPQHQLPYESELGTKITTESLILYVCYMDERPSIPQQWELLSQGATLKEILTDCWDLDPDARLTAQCVADRLLSL